MVALILQAAQQAKQIAPNVYVVVQQPASGMPEWIKILLSAVVGSVFTIGAGVFSELTKPLLAQQTMASLFVIAFRRELRRNQTYVVIARNELKGYRTIRKENHECCNLLRTAVAKVKWTRYEYYKANETSTVHDVDRYDHIDDVYSLVQQIQDSGDRHNFDEASEKCTAFIEFCDHILESLSSGAFIKFDSDY